jgi:pimeloyl-ACP methyl ester carboxylesterase
MAKDFAEMMDHLQLKDAVVVGHSMGALTLWEYISQFDCKNLSRICIVDQSPRLVTNDTWTLGIYGNWPKERDLAFSTDLQIDFVETVIKLVTLDRNGKVHRRYAANSNTLRQMRAYLSTLDPGPLIGIWQSLTAADYRLILDRISVPALLIYGSKSNYYSVGTGKYVQRSMPLAELIVYEGADHFPHLFDPRQFIADLSQFLACR